jgi:4-amino-4-deoxy-L-arabinose transferase-like glycosyltransferase
LKPAPPTGWRERCAIAALIFVWLAATAWVRPLMLPDEGRYVGVAWEMLRSGDWLTPTLDGLPFFHKPPLFYWLTAGSLQLFGSHEWAARAAPLLGAWLGAMSLYLFSRRWSGARTARLMLWCLLAQPLFYLGGQFANLDMLVAGCITATTVLLADAALSIEHGLPYRRTLAAAAAMAALGVLAKGLIGAVLPAGVIIVWLALRRRWAVLRALLWWPGLLLFAALAAPWFVAMQARFDGFLHYFFVVQHFQRFASGGFNNVQPFWFYPAVLLLFFLPFLPWLRPLLQRAAGLQAEPVRLLMVVWVLLIVLFFSLPQSKLLGYVLPAVPPLAWLVADGFGVLGTPSRRRWQFWWAGTTLAGAVGVGAVIAFGLHPVRSTQELAAVLRSQRLAADPVFMLEGYAYDVPFYAHLDAPVPVVDEWTSPDVDRRDNWRKELADAGHFDRARAAQTLIAADVLVRSVCLSPVSWVIGTAASAARHPFLAQARVVYSGRSGMLWRVDPGLPALACPAAPSGGSGEIDADLKSRP